MKKLVILLLLTSLQMAASADDSGNCCDNSLTYVYNESTHTLTISGKGTIGGIQSYEYEPWGAYKQDIYNLIIESGVSEIYPNAFKDFSNLASITILNSVSIIGRDAFEGTAWLNNQPDGLVYVGKVAYKYKGAMPENTEIVLKEGTLGIGGRAFNNCEGLTSIIIPKSVSYIGGEAFLWCINLTSVIIPEGVQSIAYGTFDGCTNLTSITIPNSVTTIYNSAFGYCYNLSSVNIPSGVTEIGQCAFENCRSLTSVTLPEGLTCIEPWAFNGCQGLSSVIIPGNVTDIYNSAFAGCSNLTSITIPSSVTHIYEYAFSNCSNLTTIAIPNSVTQIGDKAFNGCFNLTSVHITDLAAWCNISFGIYESNPLSLAHHLFLNNEEIKDLVIPDGITEIKSYAFKDCSGLNSVTIPNSVTTISDFAFNGCSGITSLNISDNVVTIGNGAFNGCSGLSSVTIPHGVTTIGSGAFAGCSNLTSLTIPNSVTSIDNIAFMGCKGLTSVTIPSSVNAVGEWAFIDCTGLTSVVIQDGVASIGDEAFIRCSNLTSVSIPNSVRFLGKNAFSETKWYDNQSEGLIYLGNYVYGHKGTMSGVTNIEIKKGTLGIAADAFAECRDLISVTIPDGVIFIGDGAFRSCSKLASVVIPNSVTILGEGVFKYCYELTSAQLSNSLTSISKELFYDCSKLSSSMVIPDGVTSIGEFAFYQCGLMSSVNIPDGVTTIGNYAFSGCLSLTSIDIPNNVREIGDGAFNSLSGVTSLTIPTSITVLEKSVFGYMGITSLTIPSNITSIKEIAFSGCKNLRTVKIPNSVTEIRSGAFDEMPDLATVISYIANPFEIPKHTFAYSEGRPYYSPTNATLYVPAGKKALYESTPGWDEFQEIKELEMAINVNSVTTQECPMVGSSINVDVNLTNTGESTSIILNLWIQNPGSDSYTKVGQGDFYVDLGQIQDVFFKYTPTEAGTYNLKLTGMTDEVLKTATVSVAVSEEVVVDEVKYLCAPTKKYAEVIRNDYDNWTSNINILQTVTSSGGVERKVVAIGDEALNTFKNIKELKIPEGVESIGDKVLCDGSLFKLTLPSTIKYIGEKAFYNNSNLKKVISHIKNPCVMTEDAFKLNQWNDETGEYKLIPSPATLYIPSETMSNYVAAGWTSRFTKTEEGELFETMVGVLRYLYSPNGDKATVIRDDSYENLTSVDIPATVTIEGKVYNVTAIEDNTFRNNYNIRSMTLLEGIESIGDYSFAWMENLLKLVLPSTLKSIGKEVIFNNNNLVAVVSHLADPFIVDENSFAYTIEWNDKTHRNEPKPSPTTLYVPFGKSPKYAQVGWSKQFAKVKEGEFKETIVGNLKYGYSTGDNDAIVIRDDSYWNLREVDIPATVTIEGKAYNVNAIFKRAFSNNSISSVTLHNGIESIGDYAFAWNNTLKLLVLPNTLKEIGKGVIDGNDNLMTVVSYNTDPSPFDEETFLNRIEWNEETQQYDLIPSPATLYVPAGSSKKYQQTSGWNKFTDIVEILSGDANGNKSIDTEDVELVEEFIMADEKPEGFIWANADANQDCEVNAADIVIIVSKIQYNKK